MMTLRHYFSLAIERQSTPFPADVLAVERETVATGVSWRHIVKAVVLTDIWDALASVQSLFGTEPAFVVWVRDVVTNGVATSIVASGIVAETRGWALDVEGRMVADAGIGCADTLTDGEAVGGGGGCEGKTQNQDRNGGELYDRSVGEMKSSERELGENSLYKDVRPRSE